MNLNVRGVWCGVTPTKLDIFYMKKHIPEIVCWRITSKCDRKCSFCFKPDSSDLNTKQIFKIIDKLAENGIRGIGITGGEPLLRNDISRILEYLKKKNILICLATNTDKYHLYRDIILDKVTAIGIPMESSDKVLHNSIRGPGNFDSVKSAIDDIYNNSAVAMYFSTVATRNNINDLLNIEKFLLPYKERILYWKIYEMIEYNDRPRQKLDNFKVNEKTVKKIIKTVGRLIGKDKTLYLSSKDRSKASFLINPDGDVIIPIEKKGRTEDLRLGNFLTDDAQDIFLKWAKKIGFDHKKYQCHKCALRCLK